MANKIYHVPQEDISTFEGTNNFFGDSNKGEDDKEMLKGNLDEANECIRKSREQIKKIKERNKEVSV